MLEDSFSHSRLLRRWPPSLPHMMLLRVVHEVFFFPSLSSSSLRLVDTPAERRGRARARNRYADEDDRHLVGDLLPADRSLIAVRTDNWIFQDVG